MFPYHPREWRRKLCDSLLFEARSRTEKIRLNGGNIRKELEDMLGCEDEAVAVRERSPNEVNKTSTYLYF
jgi:hypothetical protein